MEAKMKRSEKHNIPVLFFNSGKEDRETFRLVLSSRMQCLFRAASEEPTPLLLVGYQRFLGIAEIKKFISEHSQQTDLQGM